jgi:4-amino-4-deoxy-L-arabinose transferase-like glycosyltransferase
LNLRTRKWIVYALIYGAAAFLIFYNLSDRLLWADEAETAFLAKSITRNGLPFARDDGNLMAIFPPNHPEVNDDYVWVWNPWLAPYIAAASFKVFGATTFAARLPFVLIAFATILAMRKIAMLLYEDEETAAIATLLLATSVPFLLHSRQCRYYALLSASQLWIFYGYHRMLSEEGRRGQIHLTVAMILQFFASYPAALGNTLAMGAHALLFAKDRKQTIRRLVSCAVASVVAIVPWIIYSDMFGKSGFMGVSRIGRALAFYISETNFHVVPLLLLCLPPAIFLWKKRKGQSEPWSPGTSLLLIFVLCQLAVLTFFEQIYFRYLIAPLPLLILLEGRSLTWCFGRPWSRYGILAVLVLTNWIGAILPISALSNRGPHAFGFPLIQYARGITSEYEDSKENVFDFFSTHASASESVFVMDVEAPLIFYTGMKVIDGRFPENGDAAPEADWILTESPSSVVYNPGWVFSTPLSELPNHKLMILSVRNTARGASRADPHFYQPFAAEDFKNIAIYRRIR